MHLTKSVEASSEAPPAYEETNHANNVSSRVANINLSELDIRSELPNVSQTICHLKLLHAFSRLREHVSNIDGLFGIFDVPSNEPSDQFDDLRHARALLRLRIREKRWAIYVQRAADRFAKWWLALRPQNNAQWLKLKDMADAKGKYYQGVQKEVTASNGNWMKGMMPPLGM